MSETKYTLSFTTGAALIYESVLVAELYKELRSWPVVKARVLTVNSFQSRTTSTLKKLYGEVSRRLQQLSDCELELLAGGSDTEQKQVLWIALCRQYNLIRDFAIEVLSHQFETARYAITHDDYDAFFNAKAEWHDNLDVASTLTKSKARQVLFKMLRECDLINDHDEIIRQQLEPAVLALIKNNRVIDLNVFPGVEC